MHAQTRQATSASLSVLIELRNLDQNVCLLLMMIKMGTQGLLVRRASFQVRAAGAVLLWVLQALSAIRKSHRA
jgi:hypothetical protein